MARRWSTRRAFGNVTAAAFVSGAALVGGGCAGVDQQVNSQHRALATAKPEARTVAGEVPYTKIAWAVGQWVKLAQRSGDVWSVQTLSIVAQDATGFWLESETMSPRSEETSRIKMHVSGYDPSDPGSLKRLEIGDVYTQEGDDRPLPMPSFIGPMTSAWILKNFEIDATLGSPTEVEAPAGTFSNAMRLHHVTAFGPIESEGHSWLHSEIPIWGIVRTVADDGDSETVLLDFGITGATSKMGD
jgi:hypothetical protein